MPKTYDYKTYLNAIDYHLLKGLSYSETARLVGVPMMTVKRWIRSYKEFQEAVEKSVTQNS